MLAMCGARSDIKRPSRSIKGAKCSAFDFNSSLPDQALTLADENEEGEAEEAEAEAEAETSSLAEVGPEAAAEDDMRSSWCRCSTPASTTRSKSGRTLRSSASTRGSTYRISLTPTIGAVLAYDTGEGDV